MANPPRFHPWLRLASLGPVPHPPQPTFRTPSPTPTPQPSQPNANAAPIVTPPQTKTPFIQSQKQSPPSSPLDSEDYDMRAITISGENNKGAYMKIVLPSNKPNYLYELEDSGHANRKHKSEKERTLSSPPVASLYVNSNVQCVNNSMLYHTTCSTHDPGVHLTL